MSAVDDLLEWVDRARRTLDAYDIVVPGLPPHLEAHAAEVAFRRRCERGEVAVAPTLDEDHIPTPREGQNQKEITHG